MTSIYLISNSLKKSKVFLWLIIAISLIIRVIWALFFSEEYWGDSYHNSWIVEEYNSYGEYNDYKDRHLVWLPAYRGLLILFKTILNFNYLPLLLQTVYVLLAVKWISNLNFQARISDVIIILFWPITVVFSGFNMPENLSIILITSIIILLLRDRLSNKDLFLILVLSGLCSVTRHEATAYLGIISFLLMLNGKRKESIFIIIGVVIGLITFSYWNLIISGDPFFWLSSKFNASGSGARAIINTNGIWIRVFESLVSILFVFPIAPIIISRWNFIQKSWEKNANEKIVILSAMLFIVLFFIASLFLFHGADPKYLLVAVFPISLFSIRVLELYSTKMKALVAIYIIILIPLYFLIFNFRSYNIELERKMGFQIYENHTLNRESNIWSDYPAVLLYSQWSPEKVVSTESILRDKSNGYKITTSTLIEENISYLVVANSDRSRLLEFFPYLKLEMSIDDIVVIDSVEFILINKLAPPNFAEFTINENIFDQIKRYVISTNRPISLWEIRPKDR